MVLGQLNNIDVKLLSVFRRIVECGGMSAAELEGNVSRSVISRQLKDLEIRLGGVKLCHRGRAGFSLTDEGALVYNEILRLFSAIDSFRSNITDIHQKITGNLVLAIGDMTITNPEAHIADAISRFSRLAPEVTLEIHTQSLNAIEPLVLEGTYHIGIVPLHRNSSSLNYEPLFAEKMVLYCGKSHPLYDADHEKLDWVDIRQHAYAGLGYHCPNFEIAQNFDLKPMAVTYDQESIATLIYSGGYLGFLPEHYARQFVETAAMSQIADDRFNYDVQYSVITKKAPAPCRIVQIFLDCLSEAHNANLNASLYSGSSRNENQVRLHN